ncbi:hypothetical protein BH11BAC3_BH11BAC3_38020 [soil metagenome]
MKIIFFISCFGALILFGCNNSKHKTEVEKESYEKAKESLEEKEKKNPVLFLSVNNKNKHNLIGQTVIKGNVLNNAKVCTYKDVQLEISFFSKTGTLLEKGNETVYDAIQPGKSADFKIKNFTPKGTDSISIKVLGARSN